MIASSVAESLKCIKPVAIITPTRSGTTARRIARFRLPVWVVAVEIDEIPASQKPCFYKNAGLPKGAYLRVGNTNRQMTEYEVFGYLSGRGQPVHDEEVVSDATMDDLDVEWVDDYLEALHKIRPQAKFLKDEREELTKRLRIVGKDEDVVRPTLAGLLKFGKSPQEFFPQRIPQRIRVPIPPTVLAIGSFR